MWKEGDEMKKYRNKAINMSTFICSICDKATYELPRIHRQREKGHIKDLFCPWCNKVTKCTEIRPGDGYITLSGKIIN